MTPTLTHARDENRKRTSDSFVRAVNSPDKAVRDTIHP